MAATREPRWACAARSRSPRRRAPRAAGTAACPSRPALVCEPSLRGLGGTRNSTRGDPAALVHPPAAESLLRSVDVGVISLGIDERLDRAVRRGAGDELAVPPPLPRVTGHPDVDGKAPQHAEAALEVGLLLGILRDGQDTQVTSAHDVEHAVA